MSPLNTKIASAASNAPFSETIASPHAPTVETPWQTRLIMSDLDGTETPTYKTLEALYHLLDQLAEFVNDPVDRDVTAEQRPQRDQKALYRSYEKKARYRGRSHSASS